MRQLKPLDKQTQTTEDIKDNVNTVREAEYKDSMILDPLAGMAEVTSTHQDTKSYSHRKNQARMIYVSNVNNNLSGNGSMSLK